MTKDDEHHGQVFSTACGGRIHEHRTYRTGSAGAGVHARGGVDG